jgi:hypothetical protein
MFSRNDSLSRRSRVPGLARTDSTISPLEIGILFTCGFGAVAMSTLADLKPLFAVLGFEDPRMPGHAILRAVLPLSLGLALVPRRGSGVIMGSAAAMGLGGMQLAGLGMGLGAMTSLVSLGPLLDLAVHKARPGWLLYAALGAAGLGANLLAFLVKGASKVLGGAWSGSRLLSDWLSSAPITYAAFGLAAGVVCGCIWFSSSERDAGDAAGGTAP